MADRLSRYAPVLLGILRIVAGLLFLSHGLVKLFGFPPGAEPGPQPLLTLFGAGGVIESVCGALIALGLLTPADGVPRFGRDGGGLLDVPCAQGLLSRRQWRGRGHPLLPILPLSGRGGSGSDQHRRSAWPEKAGADTRSGAMRPRGEPISLWPWARSEGRNPRRAPEPEGREGLAPLPDELPR